ncbi:unnamed protein product [Choristocarpus tenellus]
MAALAHKDLSFRWILPGHGRKMRFKSQQDRITRVSRAAEELAGIATR